MKKLKENGYFLIGMLFSVVPPIAATAAYFPLWSEQGSEYAISGFTLLLILISALPIIRVIKAMLKSPSAWGIWLLIFILFTLLSSIAEQMRMISLIGFTGGLIGTYFFKKNRRIKDEKQKSV
jgi:chromate transport protein ChrA